MKENSSTKSKAPEFEFGSRKNGMNINLFLKGLVFGIYVTIMKIWNTSKLGKKTLMALTYFLGFFKIRTSSLSFWDIP